MAPLLEERLQRFLGIIRSKVVEMGIRAEQAVEASLKALTQKNRRLAYSIVLHDHKIDALEKEIDRLCLEFLVRERPIASHLRFVYTTIKINTGLERIGDYAESIARQTLFLNPDEPTPLAERFQEIGELSIKMLHDAMDAFINRNAELACSTMDLENRVDDLREQMRLQLIEMRRDGRISMETLNASMIASSRFERVADQAANICEEVLYLCTGEMVKHQDSDIFRVLFVSKWNAMRSQMAEGIANSLGLDQFVFSSAGLTPRLVDARTVEFMAEKGVDISDQNSKSMDQIPNLDNYQIIIFLSKEAKQEIQQVPAKAVTLQWLTPDPSCVEGSPAEVRKAYEKTYHYLETNIRDFVQAVLSNEIYP